jgi:hypothetical protein
MGIRHATTSSGVDSGDGKISKNAWEEDHDLSTLCGAKVKRTAVQNIANDTDTVIEFTAENWDPWGMHDNVTDNSRITVYTAGLWLLHGEVSFAASATWGIREVWFSTSTGETVGDVARDQDSYCALATSAVVQLAVGDYVELHVYQVSGGDLDVNAWDTTPSMTASLLVPMP